MINKINLINKLNREFPGVGAIGPAKLFGNMCAGIWLKGAENYQDDKQLDQMVKASGWKFTSTKGEHHTLLFKVKYTDRVKTHYKTRIN